MTRSGSGTERIEEPAGGGAPGLGAARAEALATEFAALDAAARVARAFAQLPGAHVVSTSFGAQAAVMLHLVTRLRPDVPVVLVDTGYLFAETHAFADALTRRLGLNLHVYSPRPSAAILAARHGRLWEQGLPGLERYHELHKVEPMRRALAELRAGTWLSGLRRAQSRSRAAIDFVGFREGRYEVHPLADWTDFDVGRYLREHELPYHPLWERGYVSIGDVHSTRTLAEAGDDPEATRFGGLRRECGLHGLPG